MGPKPPLGAEVKSEAPTATLPRSGEVCPRCGAPADEDQLVCLECGARLALDYRRPTGWKPAAAIVAIVVLAAGAAFGITLATVDDDAEEEIAAKPADKRSAKTGDERAAPRERRGRNRRTEGRRAERRGRNRRTEGRRAERRREPRRAAAVVPGWPRGRDGFTVVLASAEDRRSATVVARDLRRRGIRAGVLNSDDYSSLSGGFWFVFSGVHKTRAQADRDAARLGRRFRGAYPQFVNGSESRRR